jgi:poly-gamma-glutamate biosynthesis protein PgsC/CapC
MIIEIFLIGLIVGFLFYEWVGISPGGVVAPAYFALFIYQPGKIVMTLLITFAVYYLIVFFAARFVLYGRRKLLLSLILSFCFKLSIEYWIQPLSMVQLDLQSIGYIVPGLVANEMGRQAIIPTLSGLGIVTVLTFLITLVM